MTAALLLVILKAGKISVLSHITRLCGIHTTLTNLYNVSIKIFSTHPVRRQKSMFQDFWTFGLPDLKTRDFRTPDFQTSGLPNFRTSGLQDIQSRSSGLPDIQSRRSGFQDFRTSGRQDFRTSSPEIQDVRTSGHPVPKYEVKKSLYIIKHHL